MVDDLFHPRLVRAPNGIDRIEVQLAADRNRRCARREVGERVGIELRSDQQQRLAAELQGGGDRLLLTMTGRARASTIR